MLHLTSFVLLWVNSYRNNAHHVTPLHRSAHGQSVARLGGMEPQQTVTDRRQLTTGGRRRTDHRPDDFCVQTRAQLANVLFVVQRLMSDVQVLTAERHGPQPDPVPHGKK